VKYSITVAPGNGGAAAVFSGDVNLDKPHPSSNNNVNGGDNQPAAPEESLFNKRVDLNWDGMLGGKPLAEGIYTVAVQLTDDDGNTVPASVNSDDVSANDTVRPLSVVAMEPVNAPDIQFN
jgi:hypothetical protein